MPRQSTSHIDSTEGVARRLREAREARGLSQSALSFRGCTTGYVSRLEAAQRAPSLQVVRQLAARLGVSEEWLARGIDETEAGIPSALRDAELALRLDQVDESERIYRTLGDGSPTGAVAVRIAVGLGQIAYRRDDLDDAIEHLEHALELEPDLWDQAALDVLGRAYFRRGETEAAIAVFRRAHARAEEDGDPSARLRFAVLLANALTDVSAFAEASRLLADVLEHVKRGDPLSLARVYWTQSRLHTQQHEHDAAARYARKALELLDLTEHTYYRGKAHHLLAFAELDAGNPETALQLLADSRRLLGAQATPSDVGELDLETARALAMLGRPEEAASLAMRAAGELGNEHPANLGRSYAAVAEAFAAQDEAERALELYALALELLSDPPTRYLADTCARYGELLERVGRLDEAYAVFKRGALLNAQLEQSRSMRAR
jgi:tetratricopeptide (TPR) repeat protein